MPHGIINVNVVATSGFIKRQVAKVQQLSQKHTFRLAKETEIIIQKTIEESVTRPGSTGNLASAFFAEQSHNGWGVGRISYLNKQVPYWRHQNFGSLAIGANWQHRVPKGGFTPGAPAPSVGDFGGGRWSDAGTYSFIPKNPIPAMNYIEKSLAKILPRINTILKG